MPLQVLASPRADQQQRALRRKDRALFDQFVDDLACRGCAALSYRLTGPTPLDRLCVKHLADRLRVVVGFTPDEAWILLVGPHDATDPGADVYAALYELAGVAPTDSAKRTKPSCCDEEGLPPAEDAVEALAERASRLRRTRRRS